MIDVAPSSVLRFQYDTISIMPLINLCSLYLPKSFNFIDASLVTSKNAGLSWPRLVWPTLYRVTVILV